MMCPAAIATKAAANTEATILSFVRVCRRPVLFEAGEDIFTLESGKYAITEVKGTTSIQVWDMTRHMVRRITGACVKNRVLVLTTKRLGLPDGHAFVFDLVAAGGSRMRVACTRLILHERFRAVLHQHFPGWLITELASNADVSNGLPAAHPRALLLRERYGYAAVAAGCGEAEGRAALSAGLVWLDLLRRRRKGLKVWGIGLFVPAQEVWTVARASRLVHTPAPLDIYAWRADGLVVRIGQEGDDG